MKLATNIHHVTVVRIAERSEVEGQGHICKMCE